MRGAAVLLSLVKVRDLYIREVLKTVSVGGYAATDNKLISIKPICQILNLPNDAILLAFRDLIQAVKKDNAVALHE